MNELGEILDYEAARGEIPVVTLTENWPDLVHLIESLAGALCVAATFTDGEARSRANRALREYQDMDGTLR